MLSSSSNYLPHFPNSSAEITRLGQEAIAKGRTALDSIAALSEPERKFENVFGALSKFEASFQTAVTPLEFLRYVSPDKEIRDAATAASQSNQVKILFLFIYYFNLIGISY